MLVRVYEICVEKRLINNIAHFLSSGGDCLKINIVKAKQTSKNLIILAIIGIVLGFIVVLGRWDFFRYESYMGMVLVFSGWLTIVIGLILPCLE
jgi:hypothetical protein